MCCAGLSKAPLRWVIPSRWGPKRNSSSSTPHKTVLPPRKPDQAGYFDLSPVDLGETARRDMVLTLEKFGFEIEASTMKWLPANTK